MENKIKIDSYEEFNISHSEEGGQGFRLTFPNKWTVSCIWGPGHYASHHDHHDWNNRLPRAQRPHPNKLEPYKGQWDGGTDGNGWSSKTAEVAVWDENGTYYVWDREGLLHPRTKFPWLCTLEELGLKAHNYDMDRDAVEGWVSVEEVGRLIWLVMHAEPVEKMCSFNDKLYKIS